MGVRICLIHALAESIAPAQVAFRQQWPQTQLVNLLDDSLSVDRATVGDLTPAITARICALARYGASTGAAGILYTCSAFGEAIEAARRDSAIPVLKPNEAMFEEALAIGRRLALIVTFEPSIASMREEFSQMAQTRKKQATLDCRFVPGAIDALQAGDAPTHDRLLTEAATRLQDYDAIMLAQFSTARAKDGISAVVHCPVLTSPDSAVAKVKSLLRNVGHGGP
jgi:Asp/Glu/hydantoin racemase